jgi:mono/diheme cytochrome c family protein
MKRTVLHLTLGCSAMLFLLQTCTATAAEHAAQAGAATYQSNCAVCHGADGGGSDVGKSLHAADLRSEKIQSQSNAQLARFIGDGNGAMPAFKDRLDHRQILGAVHYIRTLGKHNAAHE